MATVTVTLPELPAGKDLEEFVAAFYQVAGLYVERGIIERDTDEVLELDILTTDYNTAPFTRLLTEVKSGGWGFSDLFKLLGWTQYLKLPNAIFVATKPRENMEFCIRKSKELGIDVVCIPDLKDAAASLAPITRSPTPDAMDVELWRFSYWLDRKMAGEILIRKKSDRVAKRYVTLANYLHEVNSGTFFLETVSERMLSLCNQYKSCPHLTARVAAEIRGESFDGEHEVVPRGLFDKTFYACEFNDLQLSTYVEHRARLALMKHATEYVLLTKAGLMDRAKDMKSLTMFGHKMEFSSYEMLPDSFRSGIERIKDDAYFHRYPVFWQWFLWVYGGFVLLDLLPQEYDHMSRRTGIPAGEIPRALQAYDALFPTKGPWLVDGSPNSRISKVRMLPVPFMGLGAHYRKMIYCKDNDLRSLPVTGSYTINDLVTWNNAAVHILAK